jgi:hypothetical protein
MTDFEPIPRSEPQGPKLSTRVIPTTDLSTFQDVAAAFSRRNIWINIVKPELQIDDNGQQLDAEKETRIEFAGKDDKLPPEEIDYKLFSIAIENISKKKQEFIATYGDGYEPKLLLDYVSEEAHKAFLKKIKYKFNEEMVDVISSKDTTEDRLRRVREAESRSFQEILAETNRAIDDIYGV